MTLRLSTAGLHAQGLAALLERQSSLAKVQQQLVTGDKLVRAAENPAGAAQAQRLDHALAELERFGGNADALSHRLHLQEEALVDADDVLARARQLALQANVPTLSASDRQALGDEVRQLRGQLLAVANRADGNGRALFAGTRDGVVPFADAAGSVSYAGDDGRNLVDVAPDLALADTDPGSAVFLRVRTGDGTLRGSALAGNGGTAVLQSASVADAAAWPAAPLRLEFTAADAYRVVDAGGTVLASGAFAPGDTIAAAGLQLRVDGAPAPGDGFALEPAPNRDVFATLESLADALAAPAATPAQRAAQSNALGGAIADLSTAQDHLLRLRSGTGMRLAAIDGAGDTRMALDASVQETLSALRDVDYAQAASQLSLELTALDAAQRTMLRVQGLSLFDKLG